MLTGDMLRRSARRFPDKPAILWQGDALSYAALDRRSNQLAHALPGLGLAKGAKKNQDPVSHQKVASAREYSGDYFVAMSTIRNDLMPWLVIVQQDRSAALQNVHAMERRATRQAWIAVLASTGILVTVWLYVWRALARAKESPPPGRKKNNRAAEQRA